MKDYLGKQITVGCFVSHIGNSSQRNYSPILCKVTNVTDTKVTVVKLISDVWNHVSHTSEIGHTSTSFKQGTKLLVIDLPTEVQACFNALLNDRQYIYNLYSLKELQDWLYGLTTFPTKGPFNTDYTEKLTDNIILDGGHPFDEANTFLEKYEQERVCCPNCEQEAPYSITLCCYILTNPNNYKDLNRCVCSGCGFDRPFHNRIPKQ